MRKSKILLASLTLSAFFCQLAPVWAQGDPLAGSTVENFDIQMEGPIAGGIPVPPPGAEGPEFMAPPPGAEGPGFLPPPPGAEGPGGFAGPPPEFAMGAGGGPGGPGAQCGRGGGGHGHGHGRGGEMGNFFRGLTLTDDQSEKLFSLKKEMMAKMAPKMAEMGVAEMDLHDAMLQPETDRSKVQALQSRINGLRADMSNARLDQQLNMLSVLTADQRKDLRRAMLKGSMGGFGGGDHPGR